VNVNTTAAQSRLCDPCGVGPGCRLPPVFLNRNRTERSDRSTGTGTVHVGSSCAVRVPLCVRVSRVCPGSPRCLFTGTCTVARVAVVELSVEALNIKSSQVS